MWHSEYPQFWLTKGSGYDHKRRSEVEVNFVGVETDEDL